MQMSSNSGFMTSNSRAFAKHLHGGCEMIALLHHGYFPTKYKMVGLIFALEGIDDGEVGLRYDG